MTIVAARISVLPTPTLIVRADVDGQNVTVRNNDGVAAVVLGGAAVTALDGFILPATASVTLEMPAGETLYGIVSAGAVSVHVLSARST